jgi:hypothetical protein
MKFTTAAALLLSAFSLTMTAVEAKKPAFSKRQLSQIAQRQALMRSAVKVDRKTLRRLEEDGQQDQQQQQQQEEDEEFEITGEYSIQFSQCVSLTTQANDAELMFDTLYEYSSAGQVVAEKSYVLFNVCKTANCGYYEDNEEALYMVDLPTYMQTMTAVLPQQRMNYCETCQEAQEYCQGGGEQQQEEEEQQQQEEGEQEEEEQEGEEEQQDEGEQEGEEGEQDGEEGEEEGGRRLRRKLANNNQNVEVVDCNVCEQMQCFEEEDDENNQNQDGDQQEVNDETIMEWVQNIAECAETGAEFGNDGLGVYAGFICNEAGTGVEIGIFLDDECEVYASMLNYKNYVQQDDYNFYYNSQEIVTYPFSTTIDCAQEVEYITPEEYENQQAEEQDQQEEQNDEEEVEANEYCQQILDQNALPLYDCNADGEEDQQEDEVEEDEEYNYDWYTYVLSQNDAEDNQAVCKILQTMEGEYTTVYNANEDAGSGHFYDYNTSNLSKSSSSAKTVGIVVVVLLLVAGAIYAFMAMCKRRSGSKSKKERLLSNNYHEGNMS